MMIEFEEGDNLIEAIESIRYAREVLPKEHTFVLGLLKQAEIELEGYKKEEEK